MRAGFVSMLAVMAVVFFSAPQAFGAWKKIGDTNVYWDTAPEPYFNSDTLVLVRVKFLNNYTETIDLEYRFPPVDNYWSLKRISPGETYSLIGIQNPIVNRGQSYYVEVKVKFPNRPSDETAGGGSGGSNGGAGGGNLLSITGTGSWSISGSNITIGAGKITNASSGGTSGTLMLRIWATSSPYNGGAISGYVLGSYQLNQLRGGYSYNGISAPVPYTAPPSGTYYTTLTLEEYGTGGFSIVDYLSFTETRTFRSGYAGSSNDAPEADLSFDGGVSYKLKGKKAQLKVTKISNTGNGGSGTLRLSLWATKKRYSGGRLSGYTVAKKTLGQLPSGYSYSKLRKNVRFRKPRKGAYFMTMALEEYTADGYVLVDHVNFKRKYRVR